MKAAQGAYRLTSWFKKGGIIGSPYTHDSKNDLRVWAIAELEQAKDVTVVLFVLLKLAANLRAINKDNNLGAGLLLPMTDKSINQLSSQHPQAWTRFKERQRDWLGLLERAALSPAESQEFMGSMCQSYETAQAGQTASFLSSMPAAAGGGASGGGPPPRFA